MPLYYLVRLTVLCSLFSFVDIVPLGQLLVSCGHHSISLLTRTFTALYRLECRSERSQSTDWVIRLTVVHLTPLLTIDPVGKLRHSRRSASLSQITGRLDVSGVAATATSPSTLARTRARLVVATVASFAILILERLVYLFRTQIVCTLANRPLNLGSTSSDCC